MGIAILQHIFRQHIGKREVFGEEGRPHKLVAMAASNRSWRFKIMMTHVIRPSLVQTRDAMFNLWFKPFPIHSAAWMVARLSMSEMVNAPSAEERTLLINKWRDSTLSQLTCVSLIVSSQPLD